MLVALNSDGQCDEIGWPYPPVLPADLSTWHPPAAAKPNHRCQAAIASGAFDEIVAMLETDCPAIVTLLLGTQFYSPVAGVIEAVPGEADTDYHAVLAVGHGKDAARRYVLVRNSWGDAWGIAGHAWIAEEYLKARLHAFAGMEKTL